MSSDQAPSSDDGPVDPVGAEDDVRPVVTRDSRGLTVPFFVVGMAILAVLLFSALDARRRALSAPATFVPVAELPESGSRISDLYIPPEPIIDPPVLTPVVPEGISLESQMPFSQQPIELHQPEPIFQPDLSPETFPNRGSVGASVSGSVLVYDRAGPVSTATAGQTSETAGATSADANRRVRAGRLSNPATTVIQGTVIPAVLETAIDTNRRGSARAIVSRNIYGFDGSRVLVPRGSRLIGEYGTGLAAGQNRVLVEWTRLVRPDGATIALNSPSADRLGRAGILGDVNSHFWERFASAIFRTALDVGAVVASREIGGGSLILIPQNLREAGSDAGQQGPQIQRTLTVDQGAAISVFVARDLDFTPVEQRR